MIHLRDFAQSGELFDGRYKLLRPLSTAGGTADVWLALDVNTIDIDESLGDETDDDSGAGSGMKVAIKVYRPKNALDIEGEQRFRDEYKIVYNCHHENLLQPTHFSIFQGMPYLVMPFCSAGSSEKFMGQWTTDDEVWKYIHDVASGLAYLHANNPPIIHQDIKPGNVLIDDNENFSITDFGISSKFGGSHQYYYDDENAGTLAYMAPERFVEGAVPMAESDIWALGATVYELLTGNVPFGEEGGMNQPEGEVGLEFPKFLGPELQKLIKACLDRNPMIRPTAEYLSEAARLKQYPIKRQSGLLWKILLGVVAVVAAVAIYFAIQAPEEPTPPEVYFEQA
ncbi:MAG: serine/threonine protein kinase, partial [Prevotella sp.]|nr:serine/threonine protein kinase [Prevotella sp.]